MFIVQAKTLMVEIIDAIFNSDTMSDEFGSGKVWVGMEYPAETSNYPGIWVDFSTSTELQAASLNPDEYLPALNKRDGVRHVQRWRFAGTYSFTAVAMTSLERDSLLDTLIRTIAFGSSALNFDFKHMVENNDLIGLTMQFDRFGLIGGSANPGTPWGTDDVVYEETVQVDCEGEFLSDPKTGAMVLLSQVLVTNQPGDSLTEAETYAVGVAGTNPALVPNPLQTGWDPTQGL